MEVTETSSISRTVMSAGERALRSQLTHIVSGQGFIRGTILERRHLCGKPNCRCALKGQRHRAVSLVISQQGKTRQLYIPAAWEQRVGQWVDNHRRLRGLLKELSQVHWEKVRRREE